MTNYYTYILECEDGSYYTGYSNDPYVRFEKHKAGKGAKYTRSHKPVAMVLLSPPQSKGATMRLECLIKRLSHSYKTALIQWWEHHRHHIDAEELLKFMKGEPKDNE